MDTPGMDTNTRLSFFIFTTYPSVFLKGHPSLSPCCRFSFPDTDFLPRYTNSSFMVLVTPDEVVHILIVHHYGLMLPLSIIYFIGVLASTSFETRQEGKR